MTALTILFLVVVMAVYVFSFPAFRTEQVMVTFFGLFYVAVMLSYVYQTRMLPDGGSGRVAHFPELLGVRHLCLLRGHAHREAQDGAPPEPEEIRGGRRGGRPGRGASWAPSSPWP